LLKSLLIIISIVAVAAGIVLIPNFVPADKIADNQPTVISSQKSVPIVAAARSQIGKTLRYDGSYQKLDYPNGDIPIETGVCTDVIIRALRQACNMDLQKLVHEDMRKNFSVYPKKWGLTRPDRNIDHRRVPNLQTFFSRRGWKLKLKSDFSNFQPGDLVTCIVPPHLPHIMIISNKLSPEGRPYVIHNIGAGAQEEDVLSEFELTGHYRIK
jgi:uncharacterized protein YijF (DUF1287 family)